MHLTHNFPFLCQAVLDSNAGCGTIRFVVVDAIYFSFFPKPGRVTCDESWAIIHTVHLRLIYEAKIQVLSFSWKLPRPRYFKTKSLLCLEASQIVAENLINSIKSYCTSFTM